MVSVLKTKSRVLLALEITLCMVAAGISLGLRYLLSDDAEHVSSIELIFKGGLYVGILSLSIFLNDLYRPQILAHKRRLLARLAKSSVLSALVYGLLVAVIPEQTQGRLVFAGSLVLTNVSFVLLYLVLRPSMSTRAWREQILILGGGRLAHVLKLELTRGDYRQQIDETPDRERRVLEGLVALGQGVEGALARLEEACEEVDLLVLTPEVTSWPPLALSPELRGMPGGPGPSSHPGIIVLSEVRSRFPGGTTGLADHTAGRMTPVGYPPSEALAQVVASGNLEFLLRGLVLLKLRGKQILRGQDYYELLTGRVFMQQPADPLFFTQAEFRIDKLSTLLKRVWEWVLAFLMLMLALPWLIFVPIAILIDSGRPLLFVQERVGRNGQIYRLFKWRSMDAHGNVTRVGRIIRKTKLDELPQLINVLRGEMALVGPRPEMPSFVKKYDDLNAYYALRQMVRPGLTGWAQLMFPDARADDAIIKLSFDLYYVKHFNLVSDMVIMAETFKMIVFGGIARAMRHRRLAPQAGDPTQGPTPSVQSPVSAESHATPGSHPGDNLVVVESGTEQRGLGV